MALTITNKVIRSTDTPHTAELLRFEASDAWRVSWLPQRLMDRNAAITAMTLADLVSEGEGIGLHDDPRWPEVDALATELGLAGPDAVVRVSEPPAPGGRTVSDVSQLPDRAHRTQALARHVKAALLHLRQAEDLAELAGIDVNASEHDIPEAGLIRAAGEAVEDLDLQAISNARTQGAAPADTYQHTERWCHAPGGALPSSSWPHEPQDYEQHQRADPEAGS